MLFPFTIAIALLARCLAAQEIINGQIFTPGIAVVDAPQPNTPLGGGMVLPSVNPRYLLMAIRYTTCCARCHFEWAA